MISDEIPVVIMTSDVSDWTLGGMLWTLRRRWRPYPDVHVFGYRNPPFKVHEKYPGTKFYTIGNFKHYPANRWSDSLLVVIDRMKAMGHNIFVLLLDDYWIIRDVDTTAVQILYSYMRQFGYVAKIDLSTDRLYASGGNRHIFNNNIYGHAGYLDLIQSDPASMYHMSLWGGLYNFDLLRKIIVPGERAQEVEIQGTPRLSALASDMIVLGTKQAPLLHVNVLHGGKPPSYRWSTLSLSDADMEQMKREGVEIR